MQQQNEYKNALLQQIEEKQRKKEEDKRRLALEEAKEEERYKEYQQILKQREHQQAQIKKEKENIGNIGFVKLKVPSPSQPNKNPYNQNASPATYKNPKNQENAKNGIFLVDEKRGNFKAEEQAHAQNNFYGYNNNNGYNGYSPAPTRGLINTKEQANFFPTSYTNLN